MSFKIQLSDFKSEFDNQIKNYLEERVQEAAAINPAASFNLQDLNRFILAGGKRIRPALAYFGYLSCGGKEQSSIFEIGISLELFHSFALIHDDIIDRSLLRRRVPTMEAIYREHFQSQTKPEEINHAALSAALLGGDYAHTLADQIINNLDAPAAAKTQVSKLYYDMQFELVAGQIDDCFGVGFTPLPKLKESQVARMLECKSGNYSIQKPLLLGALLAGASQTQLEVLSEIGYKLGLVFQIRDDILGLFGDEDETGKSNTSDIVEGKKTLIMIRTFEKADAAGKQRIQGILGNSKASDEEIIWLKNLVGQLGIIDDMQTYCAELIESSKIKLTSHFDPANEGVSFVLGLADYLLVREK
jgi:geranylgeranyl diphosphate synthase, type I